MRQLNGLKEMGLRFFVLMQLEKGRPQTFVGACIFGIFRDDFLKIFDGLLVLIRHQEKKPLFVMNAAVIRCQGQRLFILGESHAVILLTEIPVPGNFVITTRHFRK